MRGGITWQEAWTISAETRNRIINYVNDQYEAEYQAATGRGHM